MSEYERLKKQKGEIIAKQSRRLAAKIVDDIMTDGGGGEKADRLVMVDGENRMGAGWSRGPLIDRIIIHLSNARPEPERSDRLVANVGKPKGTA